MSAQHLDPDSLHLARRYAEAQVADGTILGALRASIRRQHDDPDDRRVAVAVLKALHDEDIDDLADSRDEGRAKVQLFMFAAIMGRKLNADLEEDPADGVLAEPQQLSAGMFFVRAWCVDDPAKIAAEAQEMVKRYESMSAAEMQDSLCQMALSNGLKEETLTELARQRGLVLVRDEDAGAA